MQIFAPEVRQTNLDHHNPMKKVTLLVALFLCALQTRAQALNCSPINPADIVGWWPGDGNYKDIIGKHDGTPIGGATIVPGFIGQAFTVSGIGQGIDLGDPTDFHLPALTVEGWISRGIIGKGLGVFSYGPGGYSFSVLGNGKLQFAKAFVVAVESSEGIGDLDFHHVAVTYEGSTVTFYIDGRVTDRELFAVNFEYTSHAAIGNLGDLSANPFGRVDEVTLYRRVLSDSEIQAIYAAGSAGKCGRLDSDGDGVLDVDDLCPNTPAGEIVSSTGCSIAQIVPCAGPWKNHGQYVSAVVHATDEFFDAGIITEDQKDAIVSAAAQSSCGKK